MATNKRISFSAIHKQLAQKFSTPNARSQDNLYSSTPRPPKPPIPPKPNYRSSLFQGQSETNQIPPPNAENINTRPKPIIPPKLRNRLSLFKGKSEIDQGPVPNAENNSYTTAEEPSIPPDEEKIEVFHDLTSNIENCKNQDEEAQKPQKPWYFHFHRFFVFLLLPLRMCVLYYLDILSDIMQSIGLYMNCHVRYFSVSLSIIVSSYLITALHVKFSLKYSWCESIFFPWQFE